MRERKTARRMEKTPPFDSAVDTFRSFLRGEGVSDSIRWIWRDFIYTRRAPGSRKSWTRPIYLDGKQSAEIEDVERYYNRGIDRGLGIALCVFCIADGTPCCYVYVPEDEADASYRMMTSLKCQLPTPAPTARVVANPLHRAMLRLFLRPSCNSWIKNVPSLVDARA